MEYVVVRRVERAKAMISGTREPLAEVALACGFADQAHLNRRFRDIVGISPGRWRRSNVPQRSQDLIAPRKCPRRLLCGVAYPLRSAAVSSDNRDPGRRRRRNSRPIRLVEPTETGPWHILQRLDLAERFATFEDALRSYLERAGITRLPPLAAIAVAGPVVAGTARFTNRGWEISEQALREVGFERALLINDFAALALAVDLLDEKHLHTIGPQLQRSSRAEPSPSSARVQDSACPVSRDSAIGRACRWRPRAGTWVSRRAMQRNLRRCS